MTYKPGDVLCCDEPFEIVVFLWKYKKGAFVETSIEKAANFFPWIKDANDMIIGHGYRDLTKFVKIGRL